jgi:hypothetical protein
MAYHPGVQQGIAEMVLELEGIGPQLCAKLTLGIDLDEQPRWG